MKMVSAAKLRKAQDTIIQMRPYAKKLQQILFDLTSSLDSTQDNVYGTNREVKKVLIVAIASNKGLCGGFNANVAKQVIQIRITSYNVCYTKLLRKLRNKGGTENQKCPTQ